MTSALNPKYSFDTFVVGAANRLAVTAGHTVAESPGAAYKPLFIFSGFGLGKTHLLMAGGPGAEKSAAPLERERPPPYERRDALPARGRPRPRRGAPRP